MARHLQTSDYSNAQPNVCSTPPTISRRASINLTFPNETLLSS